MKELKRKAYGLCLDHESDGSWQVTLKNARGERFFSFPVGVRLACDGETYGIVFRAEPELTPEALVFRTQDLHGAVSEAQLTLHLFPEEVVAEFSASARDALHVDACELFRNGTKGLYMVDCIRYFAPAPRNYFGINRAFYRNFCDCSADGYFSPPPLNFSIGNRSGWVSFGLLDLPDSAVYRLTPQLGILVEQPEGNLQTAAGEIYRAPRLMLTFPDNEWQGEALFREKLLAHGAFEPADKTAFPDWWQRPFVVTYGDQMMELQYNWYSDEDWGAPGFTQQWLLNWLDNAERTLGQTDFTIMVDAFWQNRWSSEARPDQTRFPDLRAFIDLCHARGHKVLLWMSPLVDNRGCGFVPLSERMGVLSDTHVENLDETCCYIDLTSDRLPDYLYELAKGFFGDGAGELDCDGLKMDFLAAQQPLHRSRLQNPENGIGIRALYRFYKTFNEQAKKVKPDVLLNGSACDPRFEQALHMNRLHDIQNVVEERELRARASVMAAPGIVVDSDGAIMLSDWVENTYLSAVLYSTPSLYYIRKFHDGVTLPAEKMRALGSLLALSSRKPWGTVEYVGQGSWRLRTDEAVAGASFDGRTLLLRDRDGARLHLFSWDSGVHTLPLFGMRPAAVPEGWQVDGDTLTAQLVSGQVCTLPLAQE